jgi:outer membrane protein
MRHDQAKSLQDLQERIVAFQQSAQQSLTLKETQILEPIYQKIQEAIDKVAAEKGYSYIFNTSDINTSIIWKDDAFDITNQVKTKLKL